MIFGVNFIWGETTYDIFFEPDFHSRKIIIDAEV